MKITLNSGTKLDMFQVGILLRSIATLQEKDPGLFASFMQLCKEGSKSALAPAIMKKLQDDAFSTPTMLDVGRTFVITDANGKFVVRDMNEKPVNIHQSDLSFLSRFQTIPKAPEVIGLDYKEPYKEPAYHYKPI
jgi:hypothetical protein